MTIKKNPIDNTKQNKHKALVANAMNCAKKKGLSKHQGSKTTSQLKQMTKFSFN